MTLITKAIKKTAPALYSTEDVALGDKTVVASFFDPTGRYTFYMLEYDPEQRLAFGWVVSPISPDFDELGYASIDELEGVHGALGLGIERDIHFSPKPFRDVAHTLEPGRV
jgi:hypothetical protein